MGNVLDDVNEIRDRSRAERPSPAIPLLLLAIVVTGSLIVALFRTDSILPGQGASAEFVLVEVVSPRDPVRLIYWIVATVVAYLLTLWIARRQGYRHGVWVDRGPLVLAGLVALLAAIVTILNWWAPGDLLNRGNVPLLSIAVGIVVWAIKENQPGLWVVAAVVTALTLLANLYHMENLLWRLGIPDFARSEEIANIGAVALALFIAAAVFALIHRRDGRTPHIRDEQ